ncbi:MAG: hypothetical protein PQJ59_02600 [Spirochaetales bacterium]|nr:hypothetical protein [Spirochaetales bacterium]
MKRLSALLFLITGFTSLWGEQLYVEAGDYRINIPVRWSIYDKTDVSNLSIISDDQSVIFQISYYEGDQFEDVTDMYRFFADGIGAEEADKSTLSYLDWNTLIADVSFDSGGNLFRGWFMFLEGEEFDYQVIAFSPQQDYEKTFRYILSCLDSFAPGEEARRYPGVISRMTYQEENAVYEKKTDFLDGRALVYDYDEVEFQASQTVIEREAVILTNYESGSSEAAFAWDRYYKLIYRDNYSRLEPIYHSLKPHMAGKSDLEVAESLLDWLQGFEYGSSNTFSDLLSPLESLVSGVGDCDSLALAYLILLDYFEIEGILLVSEVYHHAMAGVAVERGGYTFPFRGKSYLVTELTKDVEMGMIAQNMSDPQGWLGISLTD